MRLYIELIKIGFQEQIAYRFNAFLRVFRQIIFVFVQIALWRALLSGAGEVDIPGGTITFSEMITYVIISTVISMLVSSKIVGKIDSRIKTGEISIDLIKPIGFKTYHLFLNFGEVFFQIIFQVIPLLIVACILMVIGFPGYKDFFLFLASLINGVILHFQIFFVIGLIGFWHLNVWQLAWFFDNMLWLFSGAFIPLWFFPEVLASIAEFLPFKLVYFVPISIFLGKVDLLQSFKYICQQLLWIAVLVMLERFIWKRAVNRLIIQGG